ncbi:unnamed protein product [Vitrella brassicaformis CCMP3155]|uniref:Glutaredoxin domain-containing protein n=2 Tax=Vitrella brassicaformis TaxID=1169539 RepID=A0A0G4ECA3_VITBC|nr:unnamed protein product [Vitrella brassicaformis CCMP3155]|mmetsp:Transcript_10517/g.25502  ORF Transcript_10517/g.25502 Transcript_10517/m.25502 type:complete len:345 (+) Transcript_10517:90-1124(+)|eukprot:CEL93336.1 unnamed protein product [Vitrella brassicaformis CCMP3155]
MDIVSLAEFNSKVVGNPSVLSVVLFYADWHPPSIQMAQLLPALATDFKDMKFYKVDSDKADELRQHAEVETIPAVVIQMGSRLIESIHGANPPALVSKLQAIAANPPQPEAADDKTGSGQGEGGSLEERLKGLINASPVMLFMKGSKMQPFCKFSRATVEVLNGIGADYATFDILMDEQVRQGLKEYSKWPTYPQLYVNGELIGGWDIIKEMAEEGTLKDVLPSKGGDQKSDAAAAKGESSLEDRLRHLTHQSDIMLFMKGTPDAPRCGFSNQIVQLLDMAHIKYDTFDILSDEEVRQGLKEFSQWPTFPQLYAKGELIGGLDIVREILEQGGEEALKQELKLN